MNIEEPSGNPISKIDYSERSEMKILRFMINRAIKYGVLEDDRIRVTVDTPYSWFRKPDRSLRLTESTYDLKKVRLLAPCLPSKIVALGLNYRSHAEETKLQIPSVPLIFLKPSTGGHRARG